MELRLQEFSHRLHPEIKLSLHVVFGPAGDYRDDPRMVSEPFQTTRIILVSHVVYESMGMPLIAYNLKPCPRRRVSAGRIPTALSTRSEQLGPSLVLEFLRSLHDSSLLYYTAFVSSPGWSSFSSSFLSRFPREKPDSRSARRR